MNPADQPGGEKARVLLLVTTRRDAEITRRLLHEVGLEGEPCTTLATLREEAARGAAALLMTEEAMPPDQVEDLVRIIHPSEDGLDLPTVLLTRGGARSPLVAALAARVQNLTVLERPAPISSIVSATRAAVRVSARQRELVVQLERIRDLQRQLTNALTASELGTFHYSIPEGKMVWDAQCRVHCSLPDDGEVDLERFYATLHPDDREPTRQAIEACVFGADKYAIEFRTISPAAEIRWVRASGQTRRDAAGRPLVFSGTTQDVSARKKLEEERERLFASERAARLASEDANRLKDEFLGTLSHELRTPLNAIVGWVDLMKEDSENPDSIRQGLEVIDRNVRAQSQLIDDLLDVSRIVSGKVRLEVKSLQLGDVLRGALESVRPAALVKKVRLEAVLPERMPPVSGDFGRLQQVAWNLLTNAIKFTPPGGEVRVVLTRAGSGLEVSVSDTGEGIDPAFLPHVFERFRQADGSASRRHGGLGLGLSIVRTLVEMHGGRVSVRSAGQGKGATFSFQVPLLSPAKSAAQSPAAIPAPRRAAPAEERPDLAGIKILIVDDEPDTRTMMRRLLESCQATAMEAASAADAERVIEQRHPDILLSDIGMPGTDGYEFIRRVRSQGLTVPAVALTAFARAEDRARSIQAGFQAHLVKPVRSTEVLALVAGLCGRRSPRP